MTREILAKSEAEVDQWRQALTDALGAHGELIVELIPNSSLSSGTDPIESLIDLPTMTDLDMLDWHPWRRPSSDLRRAIKLSYGPRVSSGNAAHVINNDFLQSTGVHVENEASDSDIFRYPWMGSDLPDLHSRVLPRVFEGKQTHRDRRGVTSLSGELFVQLLVSEGCEAATGVIEEHDFLASQDPRGDNEFSQTRHR